MFKVSKGRLVAGAATVALAASGIGIGVVSAGASTSQCQNAGGKLSGSCGDLATVKSGYGLAVKNANAKLNAQIVGSDNLTTDKATDFYIHQTNGNPNERVMEYAPHGNRSGLCVSQTSQYAGLTLRYCNGGANQEFYALGNTQDDTAGLQWINAATGKVIDISKGTVTTEDLATSSNDKGTYLHWVGP